MSRPIGPLEGYVGIQCCRYCVPPKRHIGCHGTCPDYEKERKQLQQDKAKIRENYMQNSTITKFDYDKVSVLTSRYHQSSKKSK